MAKNKEVFEGYLKKLQQLESGINDDTDDVELLTELNQIIDGLTNESQKSVVHESLQAELKFVNKSNNPDPTFAKDGDSGFDLRAFLPFDTHIPPGKIRTIPTGFYFEVKKGLELQIRSRSGLARNKNVMVLNSPGTGDSGFRGEIEIILANFGEFTVTVKNGDRIAQGVVCPVYGEGYLRLKKVETLSKSERSDGGFGHTGVK